MRARDQEFSERGPIPRRMLIKQLKTTVREACEIIDRLSAETLLQDFSIQGFHVSGLVAILHVYEHFAYHAGQIAYITKLRCGQDLRFTRLPGEKPVARRQKAAHP